MISILKKAYTVWNMRQMDEFSHDCISVLGGLKVGASVAYENTFEVLQLQKQSEKFQLPFGIRKSRRL